MITGFENITIDLTEDEKKLVPLFVNGFASKKGKDHSVTNKEIVAKMKPRFPQITEVRVRKIINFIRTRNLIPGLVASSNGYYITDDRKEIEKYIQSLDSRLNEIARVKNSFLRYLRQLE